jgi:hypothetical protein
LGEEGEEEKGCGKWVFGECVSVHLFIAFIEEGWEGGGVFLDMPVVAVCLSVQFDATRVCRSATS